MRKVGFSILSCDLVYLKEALDKCDSCVDFIHFDIMDGVFVNNISFGPSLLHSVKKCTNLPLDVHLMVSDIYNKKWLIDSVARSAHRLFIHYEACKDISELKCVVDIIKAHGAKPGIAFNPETDIDVNIFDFVSDILILCVNPGFGGQAFIDCSSKVDYIHSQHIPNIEIVFDGGINNKVMSNVHKSVDVISGSFLNNAENFEQAVSELRNL